MPMQIALDDLLSILLARVEEVALETESQKRRFDVMWRVLYQKGLISEKDVLDSIRKENQVMKDAELINELPPEDMVKIAAKEILLWLEGDAAAIKQMREDGEKRMAEYAAKQQIAKLDIAPAAMLNRLDRLGGPPHAGKKIFI